MRRIISVLAVMAVMVAMLAASVLPTFAQQGPSTLAPGCEQLVENADPHIRPTPAFENAFVEQLEYIGSIGRFAPHPGGRG